MIGWLLLAFIFGMIATVFMFSVATPDAITSHIDRMNALSDDMARSRERMDKEKEALELSRLEFRKAIEEARLEANETLCARCLKSKK